MSSKRPRRSKGYRDGYKKGYESGYAAGLSRGKHDALAAREQASGLPGGAFDGTSIIIPTYNKGGYLQECISSIKRYTHTPYEIIVIDNASTDGTADYLRSDPSLRYAISDHNLGFAGAVNYGLHLARGSTLLILNNDSVVTSSWLSNLLHCLHSYPRHSIVGPVTNYISGDQLIEPGYRSIEEMQAFAAAFNRQDPARWQETSRLTGFCMLMRRQDFERLGYFDEGFEIGNCEDDDYGLRARLLGMALIIAKDTFIHHYGSVSMKGLSDRFQEVYERNLAFYSTKWSDPAGMLSLEWQRQLDAGQLRTVDCYPSAVLVHTKDGARFWVEAGVRRPVDGHLEQPAVRLAEVDVMHWPLGSAIAADDVRRRLQQLAGDSATDHSLYRLPDGGLGQVSGGRLHRIMNGHTRSCWGMDGYTVHAMPASLLNSISAGPPLIAPPVIKSNLL